MKAQLLVSALCLTLFSTYSIAGDKEGLYVGIKAGTLKVDTVKEIRNHHKST
jgi:hypothetical protein